jgi:hypothetical protein
MGKRRERLGVLDVPCSGTEDSGQRAAHAGEEPLNKAIAWSQTWVDVSLLRGFSGSACYYRADSFADGQPFGRRSMDRRIQLRLTCPADTSEGKHAGGMRSELNVSALHTRGRGPRARVESVG